MVRHSLHHGGAFRRGLIRLLYMGTAMLEFAESLLKEIRKLQADTEAFVLNGNIADMERYRFMMGRLEGLRMVDAITRELLAKRSDDDF